MKAFYAPSGLWALGTAGATAFTDPDSDLPYLIPAAGAAAQAPKVLEEGIASVKGYRAMKRTGDYSKAALKAAKRQLAKAGGGYVLAGLAAAGVPFAMRHYQRRPGN